jgi:hypothetical protein
VTGVPAVDLLLAFCLLTAVAQMGVTIYGGRRGWSTGRVFATAMVLGGGMLVVEFSFLRLGFGPAAVIVGIFVLAGVLWWVGVGKRAVRRGRSVSSPPPDGGGEGR